MARFFSAFQLSFTVELCFFFPSLFLKSVLLSGCYHKNILFGSDCPFLLVPRTALTIHDILPEDPLKYDKMRPPKKDGQPTIVYFHVTVMGLDSIDETSMVKTNAYNKFNNNINNIRLSQFIRFFLRLQTYAADIFFAQTWKDHRLRLPENMTSEYRLLEVDWLKNMWRPDSFFKNAKSVTFQTMTIPNHYMWLYKDKTILYMVK